VAESKNNAKTPGKAPGKPHFSGKFYRKLDDKGKLSIPSKFSDKIGEGNDVYVTQHTNGSLWMFPEEIWEQFCVETLPTLPGVLKDYLVGNSQELKVIKNGRVQLPQALREHAGLQDAANNEACILGVGNTIQIWEKSRRAAFESRFKRDEEIQKIMDNLNI
jgi:division/cell wall cluster transcriptional repressor MraZ